MLLPTFHYRTYLCALLFSTNTVAAHERVQIDNATPDQIINRSLHSDKPINAQSEAQSMPPQWAALLGAGEAKAPSQSLQDYEQRINRAMLNKDWAAIPQLLQAYQQFPQHDRILYRYVQGALLHHQKQYRQAISLYREIIAEHPDLSRVRMDLAIMLFNDKQYSAAADQFRKVRADFAQAPVVALIDHYLAAIDKAAHWNVDFGINYHVNNNVNNAASSPTINVFGTTFLKTPESLPQRAEGVNYSLSLSRDVSVQGNHYASFGLYNARHWYWSDAQYNDFSTRLSLGYRYKDTRNQFSLRPFVARYWYGGHTYHRSFGIDQDYSHWMNERWQWRFSSSFERIDYLAYDSYDGDTYRFNTGVAYFPSAKQYFYLGVGVSNNNTQDFANSSRKNSLQFNWGQEWPYGLSTRLYANYAQHSFKAPHYLYAYAREDDETTIRLTLWQRDWHHWGITPKLTYEWQKIDSNLSDLYSRDGQRFYVELEKTF